MTTKQLEIAEMLEDLVHKRFSKRNLTKKINEIFLTNGIEISWRCYEDGGLSDYNAMFTSHDNDALDEEIWGDFDIYYLNCKKPNEQDDDIYVTEVGYDFNT